MLKIDRLELGPVQTNCYIVSNQNKECLIFDPGEESERIKKLLKQKNLKPVAILLTHAHFDHIGAVDELRDAYGVPVYLHEQEKEWLGNANLNGSGKYPTLPDYRLKDADFLLSDEKVLTVGDFSMELYHTPGHSPGSVSFVFRDDHFAIVGDTLFLGSIGRTDLVGGNTDRLLKSIRESLLTLPDGTFLFPGHGLDTTPEREAATNPFLK